MLHRIVTRRDRIMPPRYAMRCALAALRKKGQRSRQAVPIDACQEEVGKPYVRLTLQSHALMPPPHPT